MNFLEKSFEMAERIAKHPVACLCAVVALGLCYRSYKIVPPQNFGVQVTAGKLVSDTLEPGFHFKWPLYDAIYPFSNNTIIIESEVGPTAKSSSTSSGGTIAPTEYNSSDRNPIYAKLRTHYRINPKVGAIALRLDDMTDDNGSKVFKELESQSHNAVVGSRPAAETLDDPKGYLEALLSNLQWRLGQNNLPIQIDTIELLWFHADLNKPIQFRIKSNGHVEEMAGPAAVSVKHGGVVTESTTPETGPTNPKKGQATITVTPKTSTTPVDPN